MCNATNYLTCNVQTAQLLGKLVLLVAFSICDPASFVIEERWEFLRQVGWLYMTNRLPLCFHKMLFIAGNGTQFGPKIWSYQTPKTKDQDMEASSTLAWPSLCSERKSFTTMGTYIAVLVAFISRVGYDISNSNYHCISYLKLLRAPDPSSQGGSFLLMPG